MFIFYCIQYHLFGFSPSDIQINSSLHYLKVICLQLVNVCPWFLFFAGQPNIGEKCDIYC